MVRSLHELLQACTVRVVSSSTAERRVGTGFFVAPGRVLTCAHVVAESDGILDRIQVYWGEHCAEVAVEQDGFHPDPYPDLALLQVALEQFPAFRSHPTVVLDPSAELEDNLYVYGYSVVRPYGDSLTLEVEGWVQHEGTTPPRQLLKLKQGQVVPGLSGAPVLNLRTGAVCGILKRTRDEMSDLGGLLVPAWLILELYEPSLRPQGAAAPQEWLAALSMEQVLAQANGRMLALWPPMRTYLNAMQRDPRIERWGTLTTGHPPPKAVPPLATTYRSVQEPCPLLPTFIGRLAQKMRVVLLGETGGGKSSALEQFCKLVLEQVLVPDRSGKPIPFLVSLRDYAGEPSLLPLISYTLHRVDGQLVFSEESALRVLLDGAPSLVLLDGLNEVGVEDRTRIAKAIRRLAASHSRCDVVVTCRTSDFADFEQELDDFVHLEIAAWSQLQIRQFLSLEECGGDPADRLEMASDPKVFSNPFLLQLACQIRGDLGHKPSRVDVLRAFLHSDRVLGQAPASRGIRQKLLQTARRLAFDMRSRQRPKLPLDDVFDGIFSARGPRGYEAEDMFRTLLNAGILVTDQDSAWFRYEYLNEYLCAEQLAGEVEFSEVLRLADNAWWRESILLYLSLATLSVEELEHFIAAQVDRWVRYGAADRLGELGDPRLGRMVAIPAGVFVMGRDDGPEHERPAHEIYLPGFEIDQFPVTNSEYAAFVEATHYPPPPSRPDARYPTKTGNRPVTDVRWMDACAYAAWVNKRLPTEAEWEKAAAWSEDGVKVLYAWGDSFDPSRLNSDTSARDWVGGPTPVGVYPDGVSWYGVSDLNGNVWEWTSTLLRPYPYVADDGREAAEPSMRRVLRGGSWRSTHPDFLTTTKRDSFEPSPQLGGNVGFRCARDL